MEYPDFNGFCYFLYLTGDTPEKILIFNKLQNLLFIIHPVVFLNFHLLNPVIL
jgi:hypothetical protein